MTQNEHENETTPKAPTPTDTPVSAPASAEAAGDNAQSLGESLSAELGAPLGGSFDAPESEAPEQLAKSSEPEPPDAAGFWRGTGRRKTAVARVRIKPGEGEVKIQVSRKETKTVEEYFSELRDRADVYAPLKETQTFGKMDVVIRCTGGGYMGQAQACRLGIARALKKYDPSLEGVLRDRGFLTRDPREVERKKYGQAGARRRFQFSKR